MTLPAYPIRPDVLAFEPYAPGLAIDEIRARFGLESVVKMASNENPLGMSPLACDAVQRHASMGFRYPQGGNPRLAAALAKLLQEKRDVILLSYFMDMSDREIGELLDMARRTVQHRRSDTLAELRKRMEDDDE